MQMALPSWDAFHIFFKIILVKYGSGDLSPLFQHEQIFVVDMKIESQGHIASEVEVACARVMDPT